MNIILAKSFLIYEAIDKVVFFFRYKYSLKLALSSKNLEL